MRSIDEFVRCSVNASRVLLKGAGDLFFQQNTRETRYYLYVCLIGQAFAGDAFKFIFNFARFPFFLHSLAE